ncbi:PGF-pre-PGF domain-containing protein, partial [Candidatus Woesearchaeota archaeon]|nr:PGF-pre-PGF domain-containing protein [Candidatus Woesearchaeota archaeon]
MRSLRNNNMLSLIIESGVVRNKMIKNKTIQIFFIIFLLVFALQVVPFVFADEFVEESSGVFSDDEIEFNLNIVPVVFYQNVAPCSPVLFKVLIENVGDFEDSLVFSLSSFSGALISPSQAVLASGEKQEVVISFVPDDCSFFGEFPIVFTVVSEVTGIVVELDLSLVIDSADVLSVGETVDRIVAGKSLLIADIPVKNIGSSDAKYRLGVDGPGWIRFEKNEVSVPVGGETFLRLIINPDELVVSEKYSVVLNAYSTVSDRVYSKSVVIDLSGPALISRLLVFVPKIFSFVKTGLFVFAGIIVLLVLFVVVRKFFRGKGVGDDDEIVEDEADVSEDVVSSEKKDVVPDERRLRRAVEKDLRSRLVFVPKSAVLSPQFLWAKWLVRLLVVLIVVSLSAGVYLYRAVFLNYLDYVSAGVIVVVLAGVFKFLVRRHSVVYFSKFLAAGEEVVFDTGWKKGLLKISFELKDAVQNFQLKIIKGRRTTPVSAGEHVYSYVWFETNVTPTVVNDVSLLFKIKKSWLARRFCSEKDLRVVVFVSNRWRSLDVEIVGSDKKFVFVEAQSDILAPVAVVCKSKPVIREVIEEPVEEIHEKIVDKK